MEANCAKGLHDVWRRSHVLSDEFELLVCEECGRGDVVESRDLALEYCNADSGRTYRFVDRGDSWIFLGT